MRFFFALACSVALCRAADLPPSIRTVVETARAAPPEFFADIVVRFSQAHRLQPKELQEQLLIDAFQAAAGAKQPVRLIALQATPPDTRAIYRGKAGALLLDALSLQSRILKELLYVDKPKARELFDQIVHPAQDPRTCQDALLPDLSAYYDIAGAIAQGGFTPKEKEKELHVQFLLSVLSQAKSPADVAAFAQALDYVQLKPAQLELVLASLAKILESIDANFPSFETSIEVLQSQIEDLSAKAAAAQISNEALLKAYRTFLVTQLTAARCNDNFSGMQPAIAWINAHALPLTLADTTPSKTEGVIKADVYFQSSDSQQIGGDLRQLTSADHTAPEWRNRLADFLGEYSAWQPSGDDVDALHQRATVLVTLLGIVFQRDDRNRVLEMCATLLESSTAERQSPAEWLWQAKTLLQAAGGDAPKMLESFRASGDPVLMLYAGSGS